MSAVAITPAAAPPEEEEDPAPAGPAYEFDEGFQHKIAALMMREPSFAMRAEGLVMPGYLTNSADAALVDIASRYFEKYRQVPTLAGLPTLIKDAIAEKRLRRDLLDDVKEKIKSIYRADLSDKDFVLDKVAAFARERAVEQAILSSVHYLEKGNYLKIEEVMRQAMDVGKFDEDEEYDYFKMIESRTKTRIDIVAGTVVKRGISTGFKDIDDHLYHGGWGRKELSLLMGAAKSGKTIGLWDFGKNASLEGKNVLGITCEVSKEIIGDRVDANVSDTAMKALTGHPHDIMAKIKAAEARAGAFKIHEYATGTLKPSMIRRLLEKYKSKGILFDLVIVDYADIMCPENFTDSAIENSKSIYIALRGIAFTYDLAMLTATQTNRDGAKATTAKVTDVAEDFNKIRIADVVISINATDDEKRINEARLFWAASRNTEDGFTLRVRQDREKMKFITKIVGRE